jgi:hypothetical protein
MCQVPCMSHSLGSWPTEESATGKQPPLLVHLPDGVGRERIFPLGRRCALPRSAVASSRRGPQGVDRFTVMALLQDGEYSVATVGELLQLHDQHSWATNWSETTVCPKWSPWRDEAARLRL